MAEKGALFPFPRHRMSSRRGSDNGFSSFVDVCSLHPASGHQSMQVQVLREEC